MSTYIKNFVTAYGISFDKHKRNISANKKAINKWRDIYRNLTLNEDSVIMFCGAKNNGKSSLIRYIVNSYNQNVPQNTSDRQPSCDNSETDIMESTTSSLENLSGSQTIVDSLGQQEHEKSQLISSTESSREEKQFSESDNYVYFVDFDPGQPEMTTPGCISAHMIKSVDQPLISPTYLNVLQHEPIILSSVGGTNMSVNPHMYIENCKFVYSQVIEHQSRQAVKRPIFINTMGHIRNVGLAMLMDLIKSCKPTNLIVLNVEIDPMRTIYADMTAPNIAATKAAFYYETSHQQNNLNYQCDIHNLEFVFSNSSAVSTKNRTALQLAYLASIPDALYKPIMVLKPKKLSLKSISIYCASSYPLKIGIVLELLYHSWVHLAKLKNNLSSCASPCLGKEIQHNQDDLTKEETICNVIERVGQNQVFGCGIVVDINLENKTLAIITPLSQDMLDQEIDCIIKPLSIQVPREILEAPNMNCD